MKKETITIAGAGLVGSLLATMLAKRGYGVKVFDRRPDMRRTDISAGRSINLALSDRGLQALEVAGLADEIRKIAIPMRGRMMHDVDGTITFQPYGVGDQAINSVSRGTLNMELMTLAEERGVEFFFNHKCVDIDLDTNTCLFEDYESGKTSHVKSDIVFGADGAFSAIRAKMQVQDRFNYSQSYLDHSYKELSIPAIDGGGFRIDANALHIWPRHSYMIIALPNIDGSFTVTLFLAQHGSPSFDELQTRKDVEDFFNEQFADAVPHMPTLLDDFFDNPTSSLVTVKCSPWQMNGRTVLIGDAAHAVVPFYGQGMNSGFEDCSVLMDCLDVAGDDWGRALELYVQYREKDGRAIADLAVANFIEMRDKVADEKFLRRKEIEAFIHEEHPDKWVPLYTLVTFSANVPYSEAERIGAKQDEIMEELMAYKEVYENYKSPKSKEIIRATLSRMKPLKIAPISPR